MSDRLDRLGEALCLAKGRQGFRLERGGRFGRAWWLCGGVEGDQSLPNTEAAETPEEALDLIESWLEST